MKKVLVVLLALVGLNASVTAQSVGAPLKKAEVKMKVVPAKSTAIPAKVVPMPRSLSKTPAAKPAVVTPATSVVLKKDGTPDKRYNKTTTPNKKDGTPDLRFKKNKKTKS